jgi:type VI secretion system protein ImpF
MSAIRESLRRDLENLLNTRCLAPPEEYEQLQDSLSSYGIPDLVGGGGFGDCEAICEIVRLAIKRCEPRLSGIDVKPLSEASVGEGPLRFRIAATLKVERWSAPIVFDSFLDSTDNTFQVTRGGS